MFSNLFPRLCRLLAHNLPLHEPDQTLLSVGRGFDHYTGKWCDEIDAHIEKDVASFKQYQLLDITDDLLELGDPSYDRFRYPADRHRTEAHVDAMRNAELKLEIFWRAIDKFLHDKKLISRYTKELLGSDRELQRTPEYEPKQEISRPHTDSVAKKPLSEYYRELQLAIERTTNTAHTAPKKKVKSRGRIQEPKDTDIAPTAPTAPAAPAAPTTDNTATAEASEKFAVEDKCLKVFRALFYISSKEYTQKEVSWTDFCGAMTKIGFACEQTRRSSWHFKRQRGTKTHPQVSITFHEPHPDSKIAPVWARNIGGRLTKHFGFEGDMFERKD